MRWYYLVTATILLLTSQNSFAFDCSGSADPVAIRLEERPNSTREGFAPPVPTQFSINQHYLDWYHQKGGTFDVFTIALNLKDRTPSCGAKLGEPWNTSITFHSKTASIKNIILPMKSYPVLMSKDDHGFTVYRQNVTLESMKKYDYQLMLLPNDPVLQGIYLQCYANSKTEKYDIKICTANIFYGSNLYIEYSISAENLKDLAEFDALVRGSINDFIVKE